MVAAATIQYSGTACIGFFAALLLSILIFVFVKDPLETNEHDPLLALREESDTDVAETAVDAVGRFGRFMVIVEMLDAIPESAIIADGGFVVF